MGIKDNVSTLIPELLFWGVLLAPALTQCSGRVLQPRPAKVVEDTTSHYHTGEAEQPHDIVKRFVIVHMVRWEQRMGKPSTRVQVDEAFRKAHPGLNPRELFPSSGVLQEGGSCGSGKRSFYTQKFDGTSYGVYKARYGKNGLWDGQGDEPKAVTMTLGVLVQIPGEQLL